jgi:hypothetical protein
LRLCLCGVEDGAERGIPRPTSFPLRGIMCDAEYTGFNGLTGPSAIPDGLVQPSRVSSWALTTHRRGLPVSRCSLYAHVPPSIPRRSVRLPCRSLPLTCQPSPRFPTGSASALLFSGSAQRSLLVAARVLAKPPRVALYTEGSDRFVTSTTTPITTGWRGSCRVGLSPTERAHVFTAHRNTG